MNASSSRRIFYAWLLLLVAAGGVAAGAWGLLRREESRLLVKATLAEEAQRAAFEARGRLVAENAELLIGDVEAGLLDALAEAPLNRLEVFLADWERGNALVRAGFSCALDGEIVYPKNTDMSEQARGFRRRFAEKLAANQPWAGGSSAFLSPPMGSVALAQENEFRVSDNVNVAKVQTARRELQSLTKNRSRSSYEEDAEVAMSEGVAQDSFKDKKALAAKPALADEKRGSEAGERRGWLPLKVDGRLHLLGWLSRAGEARVRGVEVDLTALVSRLGGALPAEIAGDEGLALRDEKGRVLHQVGKLPANGSGVPTMRIPISAQLLPGWEVVGFRAPQSVEGNGGGFFMTAVLLAAVLVAAILAGGSVLLWQARRSEAEAAQKTSFVANVSHEFKTPLTTIRLYAELMEQGRVVDEEKRGDYLRTIGRETQRLARLVNNALDFSRLEQGQEKFSREALDLQEELTRIAGGMQLRAGEAGVVLSTVFPARRWTVEADRDALEQIVLNLIDNACKYAAGGGEVVVELRASASGAGAEIAVMDRGPGVPKAHREKVFEKFHRVDDALTAEKAGAGLGLGIARQLARGLSGELSCDERAGGGAVFTLILK